MLSSNRLHAVILLTVELLSETKELWLSFAFSKCAFSAHLQIQHEMRSAPERRGDCAEHKQAETLRLNIVGLSGWRNQMSLCVCVLGGGLWRTVRQHLAWWTDEVAGQQWKKKSKR